MVQIENGKKIRNQHHFLHNFGQKIIFCWSRVQSPILFNPLISQQQMVQIENGKKIRDQGLIFDNSKMIK